MYHSLKPGGFIFLGAYLAKETHYPVTQMWLWVRKFECLGTLPIRSEFEQGTQIYVYIYTCVQQCVYA